MEGSLSNRNKEKANSLIWGVKKFWDSLSFHQNVLKDINALDFNLSSTDLWRWINYCAMLSRIFIFVY